ncbi:L,D-transpeptidase [Actinospica robiniae]|uniref:L,D-transpeptidase n=1 Tax=Actinospica robiniae TaxID=304901 RepID=UPI000405E146|nr:Ig-like domain-containing protein [Actinospica robiniae]
MADAVAPGDGAEEIAEQTDESAEGVESAQTELAETEAAAVESGEAAETDAPSAEAEAEAEPEAGPAEGSDAASEDEAETEPEVEAELEVEAEPEVEGDAESEVEAELEVEGDAESESELEAAFAADAEPEADTESAAEPEAEPEIEPEAAAEPDEPTAEPEPEAESAAAVEPAPEPAVEPVTLVSPTLAAAASFVPPQPSPPSQPPAERPTVTLAGRRIDRRAALIAGGAGVVVIGGVVAALASSGGSGDGTSTASTGVHGAVGATGKASTAPAVPLPEITTNPADGASGVDPSKPITVRVTDGTIDSVQLSGQEQTSGTLSTDGSTWTSDNSLNVNSSYQLSVIAKNSVGKTKSTTVSFHTLKPSATFGVSSVVPPRGSAVGVGQPIRVTFSNYVPAEYKAALEKACVVRTTPAVAGAWYWVSNSTDGAIMDWRPKDFWAVDTKVAVDFNLNGVRLGEHQYGVKDYPAHDFSIRGTDLRLIVDKDEYSATCYRNGKAIRTFPIDTGVTSAETFVTYTGTMAVLGKGNPVEMKGNYGPNDTYDDFVNWATQITWSGTYVHAAGWDTEIGHANDDSHGCVHCHPTDAEWFYNLAEPGDVVTIKGSRKRPVAVSNGICTFTLDWSSLLKGSAYGATINGKPTSA